MNTLMSLLRNEYRKCIKLCNSAPQLLKQTNKIFLILLLVFDKIKQNNIRPAILYSTVSFYIDKFFATGILKKTPLQLLRD
jgi:hypothetical protein